MLRTFITAWLHVLLLLVAPGPLWGQVKEPLVFENAAPIVAIQYDEDDNLIITGSSNGIINLWDPETGRLIRTFGVAARLSRNIHAEISPDGKLVALVNGRNGKVWNTKFGDQVCALTGYNDTIVSVHFSTNNKWLVTASLDGAAKVWDVQKGNREHSLNHMIESLSKRDHPYGLTEARFFDGDRSIATGSGRVFRDSVNMRPDSSGIVRKKLVERYDSSILIWDMKTGKVSRTLHGYPFDISPDGHRIVSGSVNTAGRKAGVWDVTSGKLLFAIGGHAGEITSCQFSRDGKRILTASADGFCKLWDASSGATFAQLKTGEGSAQFSPDAKWIATFARDTVRLWSVSSGRLAYALPSDRASVFSNNSRHLVVVAGNRALVVETTSGKPVIVEKKPTGKTSKKVLKVDQ